MVHFLAPEATSDLDDIWFYIATESGQVALADRLIDTITDRFQMLAAHPHMGRRRDDLLPGLRSFAVDDYVIIYREQDGDVRILRVLHARRDIGNLVQRDH